MNTVCKTLLTMAIAVLLTAHAAQSFAAPSCDIVVGDNGNNPTTKQAFLPSNQDLESAVLYLWIENMGSGLSPLTVDSLTITASGTGDESTDITSVSLFKDANDDAQFDANDTEIDTGTYAVDDGTVTFNSPSVGSNLGIDGTAGAGVGVFVVYYIKPSAAKGTTFVASFVDAGADIEVNGCGGTQYYTSAGVTGPTVTVTYGSALAAAGIDNPAAGMAYAGDTDVPMLQIAVTFGSEEATNVDALTVTDAMATKYALVSAVKVWHDADGDGAVSSGDTQLGSDATFADGVDTLTVASLGHQVAAGGTSNLLVTYDFAAATTASLERTSNILELAKGWVRSLVFPPLSLVGCGGSSGSSTTGTDIVLGDAPEGVVFTDTAGNAITEAGEGDTVQLRTDDGAKVLQFVVGETAVSLDGMTVDRDAEGTFVSMPAAAAETKTVAGLPAEVTVMVPCQADDGAVQICPEEAGMPAGFPACASGGFLTQAAATSGAYTWGNAADRTGDDDCTVTGSLESFASFYAAGRTLTSFAPSLAGGDDVATSGAISGRSFATSGDAVTGAPLTLIER